MAKTSFKERERQRREEEILRTAAHMIRDRGYAHLNMDEIAEEVGVSKPTLYQHFKSKDDMVMWALIRAVQRMETYVESITEQPPLAQLEMLLRYMIRTHTEAENLPLIRVHTSTLIEMKSHATYLDHQGRVGEMLKATIQQGKDRGEINPDLSHIAIIGSMFSLLSVLEGPHIMGDHSDTFEGLVENICAIFINGIRNHSNCSNSQRT
jgi:AcrR family transcriptional regulator